MTEKIREGIIFIAVISIFIDKLIALIRDKPYFYADLVTPIILYTVLRNLREESARLFKVIWESKNMIILLMIYYGLFGWIANRMFQGTSQGNSIFPTREEAIWNMMTVFAGSNFLVKILPSYSSNRWSGILFLFFNIFGFLFFMNVTVAIIYNVYLSQVNDRIVNFKNTIEDVLTDTFNKFSEKEESDTLTYPQARKAIKEIISLKTRGEYDHIKVSNVIKVMDKLGTNLVTKENFLNLFDILYLLREVEKRKKYAASLRKEVPMWRKRIYSVYQHKFYDGSIYLLIIFSLLLIFWRE